MALTVPAPGPGLSTSSLQQGQGVHVEFQSLCLELELEDFSILGRELLTSVWNTAPGNVSPGTATAPQPDTWTAPGGAEQGKTHLCLEDEV